MLKEKFVPIRALLAFLLTILSISIILGVTVFIADQILSLIQHNTLFKWAVQRPLAVIYTYSLVVFITIFYFFIFFLLLLTEFFYRYYNLPFWSFMLMAVFVFLIYAWLSWRDTYSLLTGEDDVRIKNTICLILIGIVYPLISNFWARKTKFIKLVQADN